MEGGVFITDPSAKETIEKLLEAASLLISKNGYDGTSIDSICREAGYSKGAFYFHFTSKEDFFYQLVEYEVARQQQNVLKAVNPDDSVQENLSRILSLMFYSTQPTWVKIYFEFIAVSNRNPQIKALLAQTYRQWNAFLKNLITEFQQRGSLPLELDPEITAYTLVALFDGMNLQALVSPESIDLKRIQKAMLSALGTR